MTLIFSMTSIGIIASMLLVTQRDRRMLSTNLFQTNKYIKTRRAIYTEKSAIISLFLFWNYTFIDIFCSSTSTL